MPAKTSVKLTIKTVPTKAYGDQKSGTSGLRKRVTTFEQVGYTENFIQSTLEAANWPSTLVLGSDGRYFSKEAIQIIASVCAANGVRRLLIAQNGILSTPSASCVIRKQQADGGILLTASHNPGGKQGDFGIKYNISNGGPAPESITDKIYQLTKSISQYKCVDNLPAPLDTATLGEHEYQLDGGDTFIIEVFDSIHYYTALMKDIFNFDSIRQLFTAGAHNASKPLKVLVDPMHGAMGPYAKRILIDELGAPSESLINFVPKEDFGGGHPDPNLTYAHELVERLKKDPELDFGVAFDADGDRNMILGQAAFFVTPSDSMAVIGANLELIPYFAKSGIKGFARSMPTAPAIDRVASKLNKEVYETPTGWKFFGNLLDTNRISLCGEESFGTGSDHIREKDGLWACLAWFQIMAEKMRPVKDIVEEHWITFGRDYFTRYDYEECDSGKCQEMMAQLEQTITSKKLVGQQFTPAGSSKPLKVKETDNFEYKDPTDNCVTSKQGLRVLFESGDRIVVRLGGTGSCGATVRLYMSSYSAPSESQLKMEAQQYLRPLIEVALELTKLNEFTGRNEPTVIT